jgi:hypothetical protein
MESEEPTTIGSPLGEAAADDAGADDAGEEAGADDAGADEAAPLGLGLADVPHPASTTARTPIDARTRMDGVLTVCTSCSAFEPDAQVAVDDRLRRPLGSRRRSVAPECAR